MGININSHSSEPNYAAIKSDAQAKDLKFGNSSIQTITTYYNYTGGKEIITEGFQIDIKINSIEEFLGQVNSMPPQQVLMTGVNDEASVSINGVKTPLAMPFKEQMAEEDFRSRIWVMETPLSDITNLGGKSIRIYNNNASNVLQWQDVAPARAFDSPAFVKNASNQFFTPYTLAEDEVRLEFNEGVYPILDKMSATTFGHSLGFIVPQKSFIVFSDPRETFSMNTDCFAYIGTAVHARKDANDVVLKTMVGLFYKLTWLQFEMNRVEL